jgi:hypothetical protein
MSGCSYYRVLEPAAAACRAGVDASVSYRFPNRLKPLPNGIDKVTGLLEEFDADVVVFHRPLDYRIADSIKFLRKAGIGVVVDLDDDLLSADPSSLFVRLHSPEHNPRENWQHCIRACKLADVVTCSTPAIERRWGFGHGIVACNGIPPWVLELEHVGGGGIGWSGLTHMHGGDLEVVGDGVQRALDATGLSFTAVGDGVDVQERLGLTRPPKITGWTAAGEHYANIAKLDIGIAPLANTPFSQARSAIKVLEYAALGIPSVASPLPEYIEVAKEGLCKIAHLPDEWVLFISAAPWSGTPSANHLREIVRERHTTDTTITTWIDAWELAQANALRRLARAQSVSPGQQT